MWQLCNMACHLFMYQAIATFIHWILSVHVLVRFKFFPCLVLSLFQESIAWVQLPVNKKQRSKQIIWSTLWKGYWDKCIQIGINAFIYLYFKSWNTFWRGHFFICHVWIWMNMNNWIWNRKKKAKTNPKAEPE